MQKIATILHDDRTAGLPQSVFLSDGLGAHVDLDHEKLVESYEDVYEPKTAVANLSMAQIMHRPEFQSGVQDALAVRMPEISYMIEKLAYGGVVSALKQSRGAVKVAAAYDLAAKRAAAAYAASRKAAAHQAAAHQAAAQQTAAHHLAAQHAAARKAAAHKAAAERATAAYKASARKSAQMGSSGKASSAYNSAIHRMALTSTKVKAPKSDFHKMMANHPKKMAVGLVGTGVLGANAFGEEQHTPDKMRY